MPKLSATQTAIRQHAVELATSQAGIASRSQVLAIGVSAGALDREVEGGRWLRVGRHLVLAAPLAPPEHRAWWAAVLGAAPRSAAVGEPPQAALGGLTALQAAGLRGVTGDRLIHVAAPKSSRPLRVTSREVV